jgi:hypothetical protein
MRKHFVWQLVVLVLGTLCSAAMLSWTQGQAPPTSPAEKSPAPPRQLPADLAPTSFVPPEANAVTKPGRDLTHLPPLAQQMYLSAQRGSEWLFRVHQPTGRFLPGWLPALNQPVEGDHFLHQAGAALALARAARFLKDERYTARARQAVLTLLAETGPAPDDPQARCTNLPSTVVNRLGAAGLLLAAIHELPEPAKDLLDQGDQLARFIAHQQQPDGSLRTTDSPEAVSDPDAVNHYPGMALYGLMRGYALRPSVEKAETVRKALGYYRKSWNEHRNPAFIVWQAPAFAEAFLQSKGWTRDKKSDPAYAEFVFVMCDWLCTLQHIQLDVRHGSFPEFAGGQPVAAAPKVTGAAYALALVEACRVTRQLPDAERYNRYCEAANRALQFIMTLQYTEATTQHFTATYRQQVLLGGFHASHEDGSLRLDYNQYPVCALVQFLTYVMNL